MIVSANFATHKARKPYIDKAVNSVIDQVDIVRVHYNDYQPEEREWEQYTGEDLTDKGKFAHIRKGEIAFTCDDDILYPCNYVEKTLKYLHKYDGIVTYHGRVLKGKGLNYYHGHKVFHFRYHDGQKDTRVDVPGTGVMAFHSDTFLPSVEGDDLMADLLVGLQVAEQQVRIMCVRHKNSWIQPIRTNDSIYQYFRNGSPKQNQIADKIYEQNYSKNQW